MKWNYTNFESDRVIIFRVMMYTDWKTVLLMIYEIKKIASFEASKASSPLNLFFDKCSFRIEEKNARQCVNVFW